MLCRESRTHVLLSSGAWDWFNAGVVSSVQAGNAEQCLWSAAFGFLSVTYNQA